MHGTWRGSRERRDDGTPPRRSAEPIERRRPAATDEATGSRLARRPFAVALVAGLAGCSDPLGAGDGDDDGGADDDADGDDGNGDDEDDVDNLALAEATQQGDLRLESPAFDDGEPIPREYGYDEANVNPPLEIANVPSDAASLALVVDDPDAVEPAGEIWVHWLVWNLPPETTEIPEDWEPEEAIEGENDFEEVGYGGPSPPEEEHTYRFKCYALETTPDLEEGATVDELGPAMEGRVLARTQLTGTYAPN